MTLKELFNSLNIPIENFTLDSLDTHSNHTTYGRFDKFNSKYNPFGTASLHLPSSAKTDLTAFGLGNSELRTVFLKKANDINGRYFAELLRQELDCLERAQHQAVEWRISVYGTSPSEWSHLAKWALENRLVSPNLKWVIQVPRIYSILKETQDLYCLQDMFDSTIAGICAAISCILNRPTSHRYLPTSV